ncbi:MAG: GNAT family N-acetyltransferase [Candidatus Methanomethylophilaceae archaeon]|nr:GNAT family N-acetyltransferase [Candidatus Methanomethylophilaceae archaeon]
MAILRQANERDVEAVCALMNSSLDQMFSPLVVGFFLDQWPTGQIVAEDVFGNLLGAICGSKLDSGRVTISLFAVDVAFRGRGIGTELFEAFRRRCMMEGIGVMQLEVRSTNTAAMRFYESQGFVRIAHLDDFYTDGGDAYRMSAFVSRCRTGRPLPPRGEEGKGFS